MPNQAELARWFAGGDANIAIVCGTISGGLIVLDIESLTPEIARGATYGLTASAAA